MSISIKQPLPADRKVTPANPIRAIIGNSLFPRPSSNIEYPECDGIRGIAILLVFWVHCSVLLHSHRPDYPIWDIFHITVYSGYYGVQLFFVLSAYLLFRSQYARISNGRKPQRLSHFIIRRFFRIAPLYYLSTLAIVLMVDTGLPANEKLKHTVLHLLFLHIFYPETAYSINSVTWSLGVEFMFYLCLPFIVLITFQLSNWKLHNSKPVTGPILGISVAIAAAFLTYSTSSLFSSSAVAFCFGILVAILSQDFSMNHGIDKRIVTIIGILALIGIFHVHYQLYEIGKLSEEQFNQKLIEKIPLISFYYAAALFAGSMKDHILYPALTFMPLRLIGLFSYEIYIIHVFIINHWATKFHFYQGMKHFPPLINGSLIFIATTVLAAVIHVFISRPFVRISSNLIHGHRRDAMPYWMRCTLASFIIVTILSLFRLMKV